MGTGRVGGRWGTTPCSVRSLIARCSRDEQQEAAFMPRAGLTHVCECAAASDAEKLARVYYKCKS